MRRFAIVIGLAGVLGSALAGCSRSQAPIPAGAQVVHVAVDGAAIRLAPDTARAGEVYMMVDTPGASLGYAQRQPTAAATPGPLTDEDLDRLAQGDTQGTAISGFDSGGCSPEQDAADHGLMGYCGNVFKLELSAGKIAFFTGNLEDHPAGDGSIAVLVVLP